MVRDAIAMMLGVDPETVVVTVDPALPEEWGDMIRVVGELMAQETGLQARASRQARYIISRHTQLLGTRRIRRAY
jgi:cellobiose phosphorylase